MTYILSGFNESCSLLRQSAKLIKNIDITKLLREKKCEKQMQKYAWLQEEWREDGYFLMGKNCQSLPFMNE